MARYTAWSQVSGNAYVAAADVHQLLPPGLWDVVVTQSGMYFNLDVVEDRDILRFPDAPIDYIATELERFWSSLSWFTDHGFPHKRGILLHGPPGSGKTSTVQLVVKDVIERGGLVFQFSKAFTAGYRVFREVEPDRPVVVLMEDLDSIITPQNESDILNILDGIGVMRRVVFLATTNYPEKLPPRLSNRPSRFDRRVLIGHPSDAARRMYLEYISRDSDELDINKWVRDTEGFSLAHLKELFIGVLGLENTYASKLKELRDMIEETARSSDGIPVGNRVNGGQYI